MRTRFLFAVGLPLLALASCTTTQHTPRQPVEYAAAVDTLATRPNQAFNLVGAQAAQPLDLAALGLPPYLVPPPAGSTPRQRRQWQRAQAQNLARAGVLPAKVKNSSVATAPGATAVNRPSAPVATAPHAAATDARKASQRGGGGVATAAQATATGAMVNRQGLPWWLWLLGGLGCMALGWRIAQKYGA